VDIEKIGNNNWTGSGIYRGLPFEILTIAMVDNGNNTFNRYIADSEPEPASWYELYISGSGCLIDDWYTSLRFKHMPFEEQSCGGVEEFIKWGIDNFIKRH
jgi:hypothetical protein